MAEQTTPTTADEGNGGTATTTRTRRSTVTIKAPNKEFTGVKADVVFNKGVAKVDGDMDLSYFIGAGYDVSSADTVGRDDLPVDRVPVAPQTFDANEDEQPSRIDVAVPPPSAGVEEWRIFARGYNLHRDAANPLDIKRANKQDIIDRATALGLI